MGRAERLTPPPSERKEQNAKPRISGARMESGPLSASNFRMLLRDVAIRQLEESIMKIDN